MLKRHEDALMQRFDAVASLGFAHIDWRELYYWYDMDRISKTVWRDLRDRFSEVVADDEETELWIYEGDTGLLLIRSDGLKKISDKLDEKPLPRFNEEAVERAERNLPRNYRD